MMMRWSKQDPVDDIEIARNNAVYGVQKNRNPFVDYPGLEDYVWGDKKTVAFSYDNYDGTSTGKQSVTMAFSASTATATLGESFTAPTLTMSPSGLSVTYSSSNTSVATVNSSTGAVILKAAGTTTITASFAGNDNYYANTASYTLTVKEQGGETPTPSGNTERYEKVTTIEEIVDGEEYLLVYEGGNVIFNGSLSSLDAENNTVEVTINQASPNYIDAGDAVNAATFTIGDSKTTIKSKSGYYIGRSSDKNGLDSQSSSLSNTISFDSDGNVEIKSSAGAYLRFNAADDQKRFRYYKSSTYTVQKAIQLYRRIASTTLTGDVNKDGKVTIADVTALVNIILGKDSTEPYEYDHEAADVNGDSKITVSDVTALVNLLLGRLF